MDNSGAGSGAITAGALPLVNEGIPHHDGRRNCRLLGRRADVLTRRGLHRVIRSDIEREALQVF